MGTDLSFQILVVLLSIALLVFLILAIILLVKAIKLTNKLSRIGDSLEDTADNINKMARGWHAFFSPRIMARIITNFVKELSKKGGKK